MKQLFIYIHNTEQDTAYPHYSTIYIKFIIYYVLSIYYNGNCWLTATYSSSSLCVVGFVSSCLLGSF